MRQLFYSPALYPRLLSFQKPFMLCHNTMATAPADKEAARSVAKEALRRLSPQEMQAESE
jgi:hypothetical protein